MVMEDFARIFLTVSLVVLGLLSVVHSLRDANANEVSSCTEKKDGVEYIAQWAMDGDPASCAKTCFQTGAWIRVTLPNTNSAINKVSIRGWMPEFTQILIGDDKSDVKDRSGFSTNAPCILQTANPTDPNKAVTDYNFQCSVARTGTVLSFKSGDTENSPQLILCEVSASFDASLSR